MTDTLMYVLSMTFE